MYVPYPKDPVPTFNWVFENKPIIASLILTQPSRYERAKINLLAQEKGPRQVDPNSCLVIHLYYKFIIISIHIFFHISQLKKVRFVRIKLCMGKLYLPKQFSILCIIGLKWD